MIKIKIELNTNLIPIFSGTYENIWEVRETSDNGEELPVDYNHGDLMASIVSEYQDHAKWIVKELNIPWIKKKASRLSLRIIRHPRNQNKASAEATAIP